MSQLAILGGEPVRTKPWPTWPVFDETDVEAVAGVLRSGRWNMGPKLEEFEAAYAAFQDATYGIACTNGTEAIEAALVAAGVGAGGEVITTPYTFVATASAVLRVNGIPVFADIDEPTGNLDPDDAQRRITPQTKAIVPVHVAGLPVDIDRFTEIGRKHNIPIVYDAAHCWGTQWRGKGVGAYGAANTYSFQMSKNLTGGEGGMILSCDEDTADVARSFANCGRGKHGGWYEHFRLGSNMRMTELQAALLLSQLARLEDQTLHRARMADYLNERLAQIEGIRTTPDDDRVTRRAWHLYTLRYDAEVWDGLPRATFLKALGAEGIGFSAGWPMLYRMELFAKYTREGAKGCPVSCPYHEGDAPDYSQVSLPMAERVSDETGMWMSQVRLLADESDMQDVVDAFTKVRENVPALLDADLD